MVLKMNPDIEIAVCWFDRDQWRLLKELDPDGMDDTYEEWRSQATEAVNSIRSQGGKVGKINIRASEFIKWCESEGVKPDHSARAKYGTFMLRKRKERKKR